MYFFAGHKTFVSGAHFRNLQTDFVNGRKMRDVLTISSEQEISGKNFCMSDSHFLFNICNLFSKVQ